MGREGPVSKGKQPRPSAKVLNKNLVYKDFLFFVLISWLRGSHLLKKA